MKLHKDLERDCTGSSGFCYASFPFSFKLFSLPRIVGFMNVCCSTMLSSVLLLMSKLCLSGCLPKILITQIGHKIDFLQILCVNCTLSGYFKNAFRLGSNAFFDSLQGGSPGGQKCTFYWYKNANFQ